MVISSLLTPQWPWRCLKVVNSMSLSAVTFSGHDCNFVPTIRILLGRIKGQDLAQLKIKYHHPLAINRGGFYGQKKKKSRCKVDKKPTSLPSLFALCR